MTFNSNLCPINTVITWIERTIHSSFDKYVLSIYYVLGSVLSTGDDINC